MTSRPSKWDPSRIFLVLGIWEIYVHCIGGCIVMKNPFV
jgi:hypothetical protein